jgi:putative two-component system protein, hydrogenase maturation factor HypX/HoxX
MRYYQRRQSKKPNRVTTIRKISSRNTQSAAKVANTQCRQLRILLFSSAHNAMTQAIERMLIEKGHATIFCQALSGGAMRSAFQAASPDLIICPTLMTAIPEDIYKAVNCLIVHPGIAGDRGPSALDWVILNGLTQWGVSIIEAAQEMDAGDIWATATFSLNPCATKSAIYSSKVIPCALKLVSQCVAHFLDDTFVPMPLDKTNPKIKGRLHSTIRQRHPERQIDWVNDSSDWVIKKVRAADGQPGCKAILNVAGTSVTRFLYGIHPAKQTRALEGGFSAGDVLCRHKTAIAVATRDHQVVWITHLRSAKSSENPHPFKLPAARQLALFAEQIPLLEESVFADSLAPYSAISYENKGDYGLLFFDFYNGAMSTAQCDDLTRAIKACQADDIKLLILAGSQSSWSNGIQLNLIEQAQDSAKAAWENVQAINRVIKSVMGLTNIMTLSAVQANAGAGGFYFSLASDFTFLRPATIINPHYKNMGLYGAELHTYTAEKRLGLARLNQIKEEAQPMSAAQAKEIGFVDDLQAVGQRYNIALGEVRADNFLSKVEQFAADFLNKSPSNFDDFIAMKKRRGLHAEKDNTIARYEQAELNQMYDNLFNNNWAFHQKRTAFVKKLPFSEGQEAVESGETAEIELIVSLD